MQSFDHVPEGYVPGTGPFNAVRKGGKVGNSISFKDNDGDVLEFEPTQLLEHDAIVSIRASGSILSVILVPEQMIALRDWVTQRIGVDTTSTNPDFIRRYDA